jgi:hypothetical protein
METDNFEEEGGLFQRLKESPRTVSALIIILIVAAAIYAFSGEDVDNLAEESSEEVAVTEEGGATIEENNEEGEVVTGEGEEVASISEEATEKEGKVAAGNSVKDEEVVAQPSIKELPKAERTDQGFKEVAQAGDGVTHLARRATDRWLSENQADYSVSAEHRIFIEDYIQNQLGGEPLELGGSKTISFDLIKEAVTAAGQLNEQQLQNLSQYVSVLN